MGGRIRKGLLDPGLGRVRDWGRTAHGKAQAVLLHLQHHHVGAKAVDQVLAPEAVVDVGQDHPAEVPQQEGRQGVGEGVGEREIGGGPGTDEGSGWDLEGGAAVGA